jgi:hypothetical protein
MGVGFEVPVDAQAQFGDMGQNWIDRLARGAPRGGIVGEHAVDDGGPTRVGIVDDIGDREGRHVEESLDGGRSLLRGDDLRTGAVQNRVWNLSGEWGWASICAPGCARVGSGM